MTCDTSRSVIGRTARLVWVWLISCFCKAGPARNPIGRPCPEASVVRQAGEKAALQYVWYCRFLVFSKLLIFKSLSGLWWLS